MNRLVEEVDIQVVVDVLVAEPASGTAGAHVLPVVVVVGDVEMARVEGPEGGIVANQRGLPVVVKVIPRDSDVVGPADDVNLAILLVVRRT